ncbi:hypothetical protein FKW77_008628 [Venturia effusa]|uniref:Protein arginine methyltransferase NDUFAF7 n=1 Tax=Venturia effusa TaxID=50376 RepID=A0A517LJE0_9PEZI|nr:hypothetical protein FKW77_008628 [Venturia effusa]
MRAITRPSIQLLGQSSKRPVVKAQRCILRRWQSSATSAFETRQWSTPLAKHLAEAITTTGPIPVAAYMRQCLTSPGGGYYTSGAEGRDQFGSKGDFITSPEISQVFGELIGLWIVAEWMAQGKKSSGIHIIEVGPGRGTLMNDMLRTLRNFKSLADSIDTIYLVEASKPLREAQHRLLCGDASLEETEVGHRSMSKYTPGQEIIWCEDMKFVPKDDSTTPFVIAHEFFDALPIHVFQAVTPSTSSPTPSITTSTTAPPPSRRLPKAKEWRELLVAPTSPHATIAATATDKSKADPEFELIQSKIATPHSQYLPKVSARYNSLLSMPDSVIEISPESLALAADFARRIGGTSTGSSKVSGAALILDYGPATTIPTNSLRGIKAHEICSPFASPGQVDLSADVDFTGLAEAALNASPNVEVHGPVEQATFLSAMGIRERAHALVQKAGSDKVAAERIESGWKRLVDRGPNGMGKTYKAMAIVPHTPDAEMRRPVGFGGDVVT